jgi:hypothetical protein
MHRISGDHGTIGVVVTRSDSKGTSNRFFAVSSTLILGIVLVVISRGNNSGTAELNISTPTTLLSKNNFGIKKAHSVAENQSKIASEAPPKSKASSLHKSVPSQTQAKTSETNPQTLALNAKPVARINPKSVRTKAIKPKLSSMLKAVPISLATSPEETVEPIGPVLANATRIFYPLPSAEDIQLYKELSSAADTYDRTVGTVNFGDNTINIEPSSWHADDERRDED